MFFDDAILPKGMIQYIDARKNCEDIAINVMVAKFLVDVGQRQAAALAVRPRREVRNMEYTTAKTKSKLVVCSYCNYYIINNGETDGSKILVCLYMSARHERKRECLIYYYMSYVVWYMDCIYAALYLHAFVEHHAASFYELKFKSRIVGTVGYKFTHKLRMLIIIA